MRNFRRPRRPPSGTSQRRNLRGRRAAIADRDLSSPRSDAVMLMTTPPRFGDRFDGATGAPAEMRFGFVEAGAPRQIGTVRKIDLVNRAVARRHLLQNRQDSMSFVDIVHLESDLGRQGHEPRPPSPIVITGEAGEACRKGNPLS